MALIGQNALTIASLLRRESKTCILTNTGLIWVCKEIKIIDPSIKNYKCFTISALIALLLILFLGLVMFSIVCCCLRNWVFAKAASRSWNKPQKLRETSPKLEDGLRTLSIIGANGIYNAPTSIMDEGPAGTDNPLWIDQKYKGMLEYKFYNI